MIEFKNTKIHLYCVISREKIILFITGLSLFLLSGCSPYPIYKDNFLATPIHIEMQETEGEVVRSLDDVTDEIFSGLDYVLDDLERKKSIEFISKIYQKEYIEIKTNKEKRIENALKDSLSSADSYIDIFSKKLKSGSNLENFNISWLGDTGLASAKLKSKWKTYILNMTPNWEGDSEISIKLKINNNNDIISADITSISYILNCSIDNAQCVRKDSFQIDEISLVNLLSNAKSSPDKRMSIADIKSKLIEFHKKRYTTQDGPVIDKIEKIYKIDFATAKSRLQRSLGAFKYDNEKSAFIFEKEFNNPVKGSFSNVSHNYIISLFPDRNNTVIEFSGNYEYFSDTYGGSPVFAREVFDAEMIGYILSVERILLK